MENQAAIGQGAKFGQADRVRTKVEAENARQGWHDWLSASLSFNLHVTVPIKRCKWCFVLVQDQAAQRWNCSVPLRRRPDEVEFILDRAS